jgi:AbiU2
MVPYQKDDDKHAKVKEMRGVDFYCSATGQTTMTDNASVRKQVAAKYRESMPGDVGDVFADLWQDVVILQATWEIFIDLFATEQETVELLNEVSPFLFRVIQEALLHELHMLLARLTDPPFSGQNRMQHNISLPRLLHEIEASDKSPFAAEVKSTIDDIVDRCAPLRKIRHKVLAHNDLNVALQLAPPLPGLTRNEFEALIDDIIGQMNKVEFHYRDSTTLYKRGLAAYAVEHLTDYLRCGHESFKRERGE